MVVIGDAGFGKNEEMVSLLGYIENLIDVKGNASLIHYRRKNSKHVTRIVLSAEIFLFIYVFMFPQGYGFFLID